MLLGNPEEIAHVAEKQGVKLPASVEIVDAAEVAGRYIGPLVARRRAKGMTPERAAVELQDPIMVGTMMLALDEADGLVSGAIHSTAHPSAPRCRSSRPCRMFAGVQRVFHVPAGASAGLW